MKRLYFLVPTIKTSSTIVSELATEGIGVEHVHILGRDREALQEAHLNQANILQTTDVLHAARNGAIAGCIFGILSGVTLVTFPPAGLLLEAGTVVGLGAFGAGFGAWVSTMIGISVGDRVIEKYEKAIDNGKLLMLVDIPREREDDIRKLIRKRHPEAQIDGTELRKANKRAA